MFHPHGYLRFDRHAKEPRKESDEIVLSETEFYDFYARPTELFTYTMMHLFREYCCVFVGLSMTDENLRRLLHYSQREMEETRRRTGRGEKEPRHVAIFRADEAVFRDFTDGSLPPLGVDPLWVEEFDEIYEGLCALARRPS